MSLKFFLTTLLFSEFCFAAEAAEANEGIPIKLIVYQAINVGIIFAFILYKFTKPTKEFFANRLKQYISKVEENVRTKERVEKQYQELEHKIAELEKNYNKSISDSRTAAESLKNKILTEADQQTLKIKKDAELAVVLELESQKKKLESRFIGEVVATAKKDIENNLTSEQDSKIQSKFITGLQVEMK